MLTFLKTFETPALRLQRGSGHPGSDPLPLDLRSVNCTTLYLPEFTVELTFDNATLEA